jgi:protease-4
MVFAGKVWRLLVGIKDALVLLLMLLFFGVLYAALAVGSRAHRAQRCVADPPARAGGGRAFGRGLANVVEGAAPDEICERDVVRAPRGAAGDDHVKAVVLDFSGFEGAGMGMPRKSARRSIRCARRKSLCWPMALC